MTNPYMWPPRPQRPPRLAAGWARKRYVLPALGIAFALGICFGIVLGVVAGASDDGTRTDAATPAAASPGPTVTATAKAKPAPTVTATKTVKVTVTAQPSADSDDEDNRGTSGGSGSGGQTDVQFGYACSPVGALGTAEDGRPAECFRGKDGRARWGYDSNRG
jgi:hypothetical protein